jgi:hypothetical protein
LSCPYCHSLRLPGDPILLQSFNDLKIDHFMVRYYCGTVLEFTKEKGYYISKKPHQSDDCKAGREAKKWRDK